VLWAMAATALLASRQPARRILRSHARPNRLCFGSCRGGFGLVPQIDLLNSASVGVFRLPRARTWSIRRYGVSENPQRGNVPSPVIQRSVRGMGAPERRVALTSPA